MDAGQLGSLGLYYTQTLNKTPLETFFVVIGQMLDLKPKDLAARLSEWWEAWENHSFFEEYYEEKWLKPNYLKPLVMGVFTHEPGKYGKTESYIITNPIEIIGQIDWGEKTLGTFSGIKAIEPWVILDPTIRMRYGFLSYSLKGGGKAYWARMTLKQLLPKKTRPLIQFARKVNRQTLGRKKWAEAGHPHIKTKFDKFVHLAEENYPQAIGLLAQLMDVKDFYNCATGRVNPNEIEKYIMTQKVMFNMDDLIQEES